MATIRAYTTIEQSRKLAEILPHESADMSWVSCDDGRQKYYQAENRKIILNYEKNHWLPCWSLAALLNILAKIANKIDDDGSANLSSFMGQWSINMFDCPVEASDNYDNPIDACYEMIIKLNELNLL